MTSTLEELKSKLYMAFDAALDRKRDTDTVAEEAGFFTAASHIAQAIVAVESKLDERKDGFGKGLKG